MKKLIFSLIALCAISFSSFAQSITTANEFFKSVSDYYATIKDYTVNVDISIDDRNMACNVLYMAPNKMRMDFSEPQMQTIVYNGSKLICYLPESATVLSQDSTIENPATAEGLSLLRRYYSISYEKNSDPVPLVEVTPIDDQDEQENLENKEMVIKLILWRKTSTESFRNIKIAINPETKLIRQIQAVTPSGVVYKFSFTNYEINPGLTDKRFEYDIPSGANTYDNFLFSD